MGMFKKLIYKLAPVSVDPYTGQATGIAPYENVAKKHPEITRDKYKQDSLTFFSQRLYPSQWEASWRGNYRNPRIAEGNANLENRFGGENNLTIASKKKAINPRDVATGTGGTTSLNPFGKLDSGLGI